MESKKFILQEKDIPTAWYNVMAEMPVKPRPLLSPVTKKPLTPEDLYPLFSEEVSRQEFNDTDKWIEIPEEVRDMYRIWRPTPLVRARGLEKALDTPAHIYFKNESVSPVGSHKLNSAIPQAYYARSRASPTSRLKRAQDSGVPHCRWPPSISALNSPFTWSRCHIIRNLIVVR